MWPFQFTIPTITHMQKIFMFNSKKQPDGRAKVRLIFHIPNRRVIFWSVALSIIGISPLRSKRCIKMIGRLEVASSCAFLEIYLLIWKDKKRVQLILMLISSQKDAAIEVIIFLDKYALRDNILIISSTMRFYRSKFFTRIPLSIQMK